MDQRKKKRRKSGGGGKRKRPTDERAVAKSRTLRKYVRGAGAKGGGSRQVRDKKLAASLQHTERKHRGASRSAAAAEILLTEEAGLLEAEGDVAETWRFSQREIKRNVDVATSRKVIDLSLNEFGPYRSRFTRNGRHLLLGGARGHIALINWQDYSVTAEWHVKETVRDVTPLHSFEMVAVAQRRHAYIYDSTGMEIHCLRSHLEPNRLEFLPYHWLLASIGRTGWLKYTDTSTGNLVCELRTRLGNCDTMCQNPHNSVIHLGHNNGVVTMWKPTMAKPLVTMMTHGAAVKAIAVDLSGRYMVTGGLDSQMKVWDLRTYRRLHEYFTPTPPTDIEVSQRGLVAVSHGSQVQVWKDCFRRKQKAPYMRHAIGAVVKHNSAARGSAAARANLLGATAGRSVAEIASLAFQPFEDVLAVGHATGVSGMVVPGAGEPNYDAFEANPYITTKQAREKDVHSLLDKLRPEMIMLNPDAVDGIGGVDRAPAEVIKRERKAAAEANAAGKRPKKIKNKMRGKNKMRKRMKKKNMNVITEERVKLREAAEQERSAAAAAAKAGKSGGSGGGGGGGGGGGSSGLDDLALGRFSVKR